MCNTSFICFDCMEVRRSSNHLTKDCICPKCNKSMIKLNTQIRVPKRRRKLWNEFKDWLLETYPHYIQIEKI